MSDIFGFNEPADYAWIITKDYLEGDDINDVGTMGPSDAPAELVALLKEGKGYTFKMYDDDGILYYKGKGITFDDALGSESFAYGPLGDFGAPAAGCVRITWSNHPEWECC